MVYLPKIEVVDLRDNDVKLCEDLAGQATPNELTIFSNCQAISSTFSSSTPGNLTSRSTQIYSTIERKTVKSTVNTLLTRKNTALTVHRGHSSTAVLYIYCLMSAIFIVPIAILIFQFITRYHQRRRNARNRPPTSFQLRSPLNSDSDSNEDDLIFVRQTSSV